MSSITCKLTSGARFATQIRDHTLIVDGPAAIGGEDAGPTPPELVVASLGSCVGMYAIMFCKKHGISTEGMVITTDWEKVENPSRIGSMKVSVELPAGIPEEKFGAFMKTVEQCMVHNTFCNMPAIEINLVEPAATGGCCSG